MQHEILKLIVGYKGKIDFLNGIGNAMSDEQKLGRIEEINLFMDILQGLHKKASPDSQALAELLEEHL
ncbi:hypothetical protein [Cognatishimia sp.]|uniref:hypothetical protein n=1 Tax=Cognatishimia sp. TaxID=2211648 RepID=UPI0035172832|nr:hypothetical protein [Cognatishimia sp.]